MFVISKTLFLLFLRSGKPMIFEKNFKMWIIFDMTVAFTFFKVYIKIFGRLIIIIIIIIIIIKNILY